MKATAALMLAIFCIGIAVMPAVFAYAGDLPTVTQRSRAMGDLAMGFLLASLLGLPIGALLAGTLSWRATFAAVAILAVMETLLIWRLPADRAKGTTAAGWVRGRPSSRWWRSPRRSPCCHGHRSCHEGPRRAWARRIAWPSARRSERVKEKR